MAEFPEKTVSETTVPGIRVEKLTRKYGRLTAIEEVSFAIPKGEVSGFLGPNGAGKSTTLRILAGLLNATSGGAWINGISVARNPEKTKCCIGFMPEHNPLPEEVRVIDYLKLRGQLKNLYGKTLRQRVGEVMELCDLNRKAGRKIIGTLSKGFRQRVGLADALLAKPDVVLLDEPTIGLDPHQVRSVRELITSLQGEMTILLSSHILSEIEINCDRVIIINQGQIVANGTPEELRDTFLPEHSFILECSGNAGRIMEALKRDGLAVDHIPIDGEDDFFRVEVRSRTSKDNIGAWLARQVQVEGGGELRRLESVNPSLEDVFLAATRRVWEENLLENTRDEQSERSAFQ